MAIASQLCFIFIGTSFNSQSKMKKFFPVFVIALLIGTQLIQAQSRPRPSQKGTVSQFIANDVEIKVEYNRPVARGRTLFGPDGIIKYDKTWTPGANEASNINLPEDVLINGQKLEAGRYSIWTDPGADEWTVIFSKDWDQWHTRYPGEDEDALRITLTPQEGSHMEVLAYYFPLVTDKSTTLYIHWGTLVLPILIELDRDS